MAGRPTKLTPEIADRIVQAVKLGNYVETAAAYAGLDKSTFYRWMERGVKEKTGAYNDFRNAVLKARAEAEVRTVSVIQQAIPTNWQAGAWWLERSFPEKWGRKDKQTLEHVGKDGGPIELVDARERLFSRLARLAGAEEAPDSVDEP